MHEEGWSLSIGGGGGGGGLVVLPQENFLIQDVCRSDSYKFWGHFSCENKLILQA